VVDSSDVTRIQEAREEMLGIIRDEGMEQACPVVVSLTIPDFFEYIVLVYKYKNNNKTNKYLNSILDTSK